MDLVLTIVFYLFAILAVAGALAASLVSASAWRLTGLIALAIGTAGVLVTFSAWLVALVALACLGASALLVGGGRDVRAAATGVRAGLLTGGVATLAGAAATLVLLVLLIVVAVGGSFATGGGSPGAAAVGRVLFTRDALAAEAVGAAVLVATAGGAMARRWRP